MRFLVTGGAGFIGSQFVREAHSRGHNVLVYDALTYAGRKDNLILDEYDILLHGGGLVKGDICDADLVRRTCLDCYRPDAIFNFAAESHVDRSIQDADRFISTNIRGTYVLLKETLAYWQAAGRPAGFRYIQVSTDEVFGDLGPSDEPFTEDSPLAPHSPYSASKAAADHLCDAFQHTYGLPVLVTRCSNNYGPRQYPEKLIPAACAAFLSGGTFGIHGSGGNVRDWISVEDHCRGILAAWSLGQPGQSYCFGGGAERTNKQVVCAIREILGKGTWNTVADRPGNDRRYAVNYSRAQRELGWTPRDNFEDGLRRTVLWYKEHPEWLSQCSRPMSPDVRSQVAT